MTNRIKGITAQIKGHWAGGLWQLFVVMHTIIMLILSIHTNIVSGD
jgi:hypothetical protein